MNKKEEAKKFLNDIGMPQNQTTELCCITLLAMANIFETSDWSETSNNWIGIHDIIQFVNLNYNCTYAENSRETFRKKAINPFKIAGIIEDNAKATNSPNFKYRLTNEIVELLNKLDTTDYLYCLNDFCSNFETLKEKYSSKKKMQKMPVRINENDFSFSIGKHNELQKAILEEFAPRFAPNSECLYVGDTIKKNLFKNEEKLYKLGFNINIHNKMPDVVLYSEEKDWLYFIEAVTSVGPMDSKRIIEIEEMTKNVKSGKIFVTAFQDISVFKKFSESLAWETEVWISNMPEHMIHLNGDKFLGPRK